MKCDTGMYNSLQRHAATFDGACNSPMELCLYSPWEGRYELLELIQLFTYFPFMIFCIKTVANAAQYRSAVHSNNFC